jgi:hypothetical protein
LRYEVDRKSLEKNSDRFSLLFRKPPDWRLYTHLHTLRSIIETQV